MASDVPFTDDELEALALAADPDAPLDPDAAPLRLDASEGPLPDWYMPALPAATARVGGRGRRWVIGTLVVSFLVVNGAGLCVTYGFPEIAW